MNNGVQVESGKWYLDPRGREWMIVRSAFTGVNPYCFFGVCVPHKESCWFARDGSTGLEQHDSDYRLVAEVPAESCRS